MIKVAINGFGRIGRLALRLMDQDSDIDVVAINDLTDAEQLAYLLKYDTSHRNYRVKDISFTDDEIIVGNRHIKVFVESDPVNLPWKDLNVDVVLECTGHFTTNEGMEKHIQAGAKAAILSAPAKDNMKTIVYNVNHDTLTGEETCISAASCTTNCLAPVCKVLNDAYTIEKGFMTTVHAYTNDQTILDVAHKKGIKARRGRAGASNIIPTSTGAAKAIGLVIPSLQGKMQGGALRVPTTTGSLIDLTVELKNNVTVEQINNLFLNNQNETIQYTTDPIVSSDIIGAHEGALVDGLLTDVLEVDGKQLVKVIAWYDNEMSYTAQMIRTLKYFMSLKNN